MACFCFYYFVVIGLKKEKKKILDFAMELMTADD